MTTPTVLTAYGQLRDLVEQDPSWPYEFVEHTLLPHHGRRFRWHAADHRTFVVVQGRARLEMLDGTGTTDVTTYGRLEGWHALQGAVYRFVNAGDEPLVVLEAGTARGETRESDEAAVMWQLATDRCVTVSYYTVHKPWGHEIWYTKNLPEMPYAVKQIHMTAGHQSSLQSHKQKTETNHVVDGTATVLNGTYAPADTSATIDPGTLPRAEHDAGTGWTSPPQMLHRVIARTDYTSIEVSTPELDDVIRWHDDTGRPNGWLESEHLAARS
jgi:hypothetical protein